MRYGIKEGESGSLVSGSLVSDDGGYKEGRKTRKTFIFFKGDELRETGS